MSTATRTSVLALLVPLACGPEPAAPIAKFAELPEAVPEDIKAVPKAIPAEPGEPVAAPGPTKSGAMPTMSGAVAIKPARPPTFHRYVAIFKKEAAEGCPAATVAGWRADPLFRSGDAAPLLPKETKLPKPLERFCRYMWTGKGAPPGAPTFDAAWTLKLIRIDADLDAVLPQMAYLGGDAAARGELLRAFRQRAGVVGSGTPAVVYAQTETAPWVAVVDTAGFGDAATAYASATPNLRHGLTMAEIVADVRCPNGEAKCRDRQFLAQAFPYTGASPLMQPGGGPLGSIGSLAYAIGEAVLRWRSLKPPGAPLILNMSVAWDPRFGHELTAPGLEAQHTELLENPSASVPAPVQAVHAILVYASCLDALAIAAAGNNTGAPCEQLEAMAPARWERYPAPDAARCDALFGVMPARRTGDAAVPPTAGALVYAAGGVVAGDLPIPVARVGSTPARVLPAFQAVAGSGSRETDAWTGTSVAAATLSGLAASVWTHAPAMTPGQVVALITDTGEASSLANELTGGGRARRPTGFAAFEALCVGRANCVNPYAAPTMPALQSATAGISGAPALSAARTCTTSTTSCGASSVRVHACEASGATPPLPAPEPWLRPQPGIPVCPICPVRGGKLTLSLNPDNSANMAVLDNPTFEFRRLDGSYVRVGLGSITVGTTGTIVDLERYTIAVGNPQTLAGALVANNVTAATLAFYMLDPNGNRARASSAISVGP